MPSRLLGFCWCLFTAAACAGTVEGVIALDQPKPVQTSPGYKPNTKAPVLEPERFVAIVYLEKADGAYPPAKKETLRIEQRGYQFRPAITAVRTGTEVFFPNMDDEFHNVFSYSKPRRFDLGRFRRDEQSPGIIFDKPGIVRIYCEIHQHMRCVLLVLDSPWFTRSDEKGRFTLKGVPPGNYTLKAHLPSDKVLSQPITVPEGKVQVTLSR